MDHQFANLRDQFLAALEHDGLEAQLRYAAEHCADVPELRARLEEMLRAHHQSEGLLASQFEVTHRVSPVTGTPGTMIGPYKLLQQIGEGGMGAVYMAEQTHPVQRKVALKLIKPGLDNRQVIARFEAERQALALMDHPNIAKVLDAGTTEAGQPYFVMELVHGVPITKYCDEHRLTPRQRLELFVPVCHAIQHAHQKGIIHRDIKPSNVLIAQYDGKPVPKVIDFGVAKATGSKLTESTMFTEFGSIVGTLEYMSPEQAERNQFDIDTRSDIYSLGVLLYELLTGSTPLDKKRLKSAAILELLRIIKEDEPQKPSTRLSTTDELPSIAANRSLEPKKLSGLVRGELDWIVMKALEKDRDRRYETANGFAMDVQRYLADESVLACPPSAVDRLRKLIRRNKGPVLAGTLVLLALVGGITGTTIGLIEARRERDAAEVARGQAVQAQRNEAQRAEGERQAKQAALAAAEAEKLARQAEVEQRQIAEANEKTANEREAETRAVLDFVQNKVIAAARPEGQEGGLGYNVTLRQALESALPFVEESFSDQPLIEAHLRMTLGESFEYLGEARIANEQYQAAQAIYVKELGPGHHDTISTTYKLASSYDALGRGDDALKLSQEILRARQTTLGVDHPESLVSMSIVASRCPPADAVVLYKELLSLQSAKFGPRHPNTFDSRSGLARRYATLRQHAEAVTIYEELVSQQKEILGLDHSSTVTNLAALADCYAALGRRSDVINIYEEVIATFKVRSGTDESIAFETIPQKRFAYLGDVEQRLARHKLRFGIDHPETRRIMKELVNGYVQTFEDDNGIKSVRDRLEAQTAQLGANHPRTLATMRQLGERYHQLNLGKDAVTLLEDALVRQKAQLGPAHPAVRGTTISLALAYGGLGRHSDALQLNQELLPLLQAKLGRNHRDTLTVMGRLANNLTELGRHADAVKVREELVPLWKAHSGIDSLNTLSCMSGLGRNYTSLKRHADAAQLLEETLMLEKVHLGLDQSDTRITMYRLANSYSGLNRHEDVIRLRQELVQLSTAKFGSDHLYTLWYMNQLANSYADGKQYADAIKVAEELLAIAKVKFDPDANIILSTKGCLVRCKTAFGQQDDAIRLQQELVQQHRDQYGPDGPQTSASLHSLSRTYLTAGQHADAVELYEKQFRLLKDKPHLSSEQWVQQQLAEDYTALGLAHHADQRFVDAIAAYQKAIELNSQDATAHCKLGETLRAQKRFAEAIAALRKAIELNPKYANAHYILGRTFDDQEQWDPALAAYRNSIECNPNDAWAYYHVGRALQFQKKLDEAMVALRKAIELNPKHAWAHGRLARALRDQKKFDEAIKVHTAGLAINKVQLGPHHVETLQFISSLAGIYAAAGRHADAVQLREELLPLCKANLGSDHADTLKSMSDLAASYDSLRRSADAIPLREELLPLQTAKLGSSHTDTLKTMRDLAANYDSLLRHADALKLRVELLPLQTAKWGPDDVATMSSRGLLAANYSSVGRREDALKIYEELIPRQKAKLGTDHADTLKSTAQLAATYAHFGQNADALKLNEEVLALRTAKLGSQHRDTLLAMNNLAWLLANCSDPKLRDPARAVDLAEKAIAVDPKSRYLANTLGVANYRARRWQDAIAALNSSMELDNGGGSYDWFFLAMAYWQLGDKDQARDSFHRGVEGMDKAAAKYGNDEELRRFQSEAEELLGVKAEQE